jgi:hypothetical protein
MVVDDMVPLVVREPELLVVEVELDDDVLVEDAVYGILELPLPPDTEN